MKNASLSLLLIWAMSLQSLAQTPTPTPVPAPTPETRQDDDDVVKITTNLVQVDVTVTDKSGKQIPDLKAEDFEIYEDGKLQPITNFSYIALAPEATAAPETKVTDKNAPPLPIVKLRPERVRRTIALVVDDLGLSFESVHYVRQALKKFVGEQMQPGDLVAIIRTAGGMGALQSFTNDKRQLYAAIERVKWYPQGRGGVSAFAAIESDPLTQANQGEGNDDDQAASDNNRNAAQGLDDFRTELFAVGTLGALNYIVNGLRELPGRKSVMLISDGFRLFAQDGEQNIRVMDSLNRLTDLANRASVVIYTMDARGLQTLGLTAADNVSGLSQQQVSQALSDRSSELFETQAGLSVLAERTGGFAVKNTNDLGGGIKRALNDQRGYYLIGYRPDDTTFDPVTGRRKFHKISVKLKRPGLSARTRTGFFGVSDEKTVVTGRTMEQQLTSALTSPFGASGVRVRLTSFFGNGPKEGSFVRSLLYIDGHDLTFVKQPDGTHKAVFDIMALTFGDNGVVVDSHYKSYTLTVKSEVEPFIKQGLVYTLTLPVKKPGAYQLRVALRDTATERVGSASQFIEAPDIGKGRLALSGLAISAAYPAQKDSAEPYIDPEAMPAVRRFRAGMNADFGFFIFNAKPGPDKKPQLTTQIKLFHEGKEIYAGQVRPFALGSQADLKRLMYNGSLSLGTTLQPGDYVLQVIVTDTVAKGKHRVATQFADFELVK